MNHKYSQIIPNIIVYDLETTGKDPEVVFPIQFAAIVVDGTSLKIKDGDVFNQMCKPPNFQELVDSNDSVWKFHAEHRKLSIPEVQKLVESAPPMSVVFNQFKQFIERFKNKGKQPELGGFNIFNYDNVIIKRLLGKETCPWSPIFYHDVMQDCKSWLRSSSLTSNSLDSLRNHFGLSKGGHEALKDCKDTAIILTRFLQYKQKLAIDKDYFAQAFKG